MRASSSTRLLLLGAVRIFQPVHGYLVRRELLSWRIEHWANINPGSIYNGLRTLTKENYLEEVGTESEGGRPARTSYRLTVDGETEYQTLLAESLWRVDANDPAQLMTGLSFFVSMSRAEAVEAFEARELALHLELKAAAANIRALPAAKGTPTHVFEALEAARCRLAGELDYVRGARSRIDRGDYAFADEAAYPELPEGGEWKLAGGGTHTGPSPPD